MRFFFNYYTYMLHRILDYLLHARTSPEDFKCVAVAIAKSNLKSLNTFSFLATAFFGIAMAASLTLGVDGISQKAVGYSVGFLSALVIYIFNRTLVAKHIRILPYFTAAFQVMMYAAGMFITFVSSPDQLTITLFALFLVVPQLFYEKPLRVTIITVLTAITFAVLHLATDIKPQEICHQELVNMAILGLLGIALGMHRARIGLERFVFEYKMNRLNDQVQETQSLYWKSMGDIYVSMAQVDLDTDKYKLIRSNNFINKAMDKSNDDYSKNIKLVIEATAQPEYLEDILNFVDTSTIRQRLKGKRTITYEFMGRNFGWCRARYIAVNTLGDETPRHVIFTVEDINEQKSREKHLTTMAETDSMTGLYNRQGGSAKIKQLLTEGHKGMLCLFDVDKFKYVNDTFGHQTGDNVIIAVGNAMRSAFRDRDIVMRLGGDEFIVFAEGITSEELGAKVIQRFFNILDKASIEGHEDYKISISLGATFATQDTPFEVLYKQADTCTYESKKISGRSFTFHRG